MAPVQIVLGVEDNEYIELLLRYIRGSEYAAKVRIHAFSNVEMFLDYMNRESAPGLVAAEEPFLKNWLDGENIGQTRWVKLDEYANQGSEGPVVAKYQPLQHLLEQLCGMTGRSTTMTVRQSEQTWITTVYSAASGSGKSVTAMNMAKQLGLHGLSVFYLNLEAASSTNLLTLEQNPNDDQGLSRLLYDLQAASENQKQPAHPPSHYAVQAAEIRSDTFVPPVNVNELLRMTEEETLLLIDYIAASGEYDHLIIDVESGWQERTRAALARSHRIVWLLTDDLPSMSKTQNWLAYWQTHHQEWYEQIMSQTSFIMNRFTGTRVNSLPAQGMNIEGTLPYVPSWKQVSSSELLWCSPIFQRDILKLCRLDHEHADSRSKSLDGVGM